MDTQPFPPEAARDQLERVLASPLFRSAERSSALLRYLVERGLDGQSDRLKEYTVGIEALGKDVSFDPRTDPIVRAEASRLRTRLERYYAKEGAPDSVVIEVPKGAYIARFRLRAEENPTPADGAANAEVEPLQAEPTAPSRPLAWVVIGSLLTLAAFAAGAWIARGPVESAPEPVMRLDVLLQETGHVASEVGTDVVISPDGARLVFVSADSLGVVRLRTRRLDGSPPVDLPGTQGARGPFFSPDGRWVGFWAAGQVRKISVDGGSPVVLTDATDMLGATWGRDDIIIANLNSSSKLSRFPSAGGTPTVVLDLAADGARPLWPQFLPDGKHVVYTSIGGSGSDKASIDVIRLADGKRTLLRNGGTFGRFVAPGFLTWVNQGTLFAAAFDVDRLAIQGRGTPVLDSIAYSASFGFAQVDVSQTGIAVYARAPDGGNLVTAWIDSAGRSTRVLDAAWRYTWPTLSPDGRRLAVSMIENAETSVAIFDGVSEGTLRLERRLKGYSKTAWSLDSRFLVASGEAGLARVSIDGTTRMLAKNDVIRVPWSMTCDGRRVALHVMSPPTAFDLWTMAVDSGGGVTEIVRQTPGYEVYPAMSPDCRWVAYASNESGSWEVYVRTYPENGTPVQVSKGGGRVSRWSRDARTLFYATDDQRLMTVSVNTSEGRVVPGAPRQWTPRRLGNTGVLANFDLASSGRVLALIAPDGGTAFENHVTLVTNFADAVRRRTARP